MLAGRGPQKVLCGDERVVWEIEAEADIETRHAMLADAIGADEVWIMFTGKSGQAGVRPQSHQTGGPENPLVAVSTDATVLRMVG